MKLFLNDEDMSFGPLLSVPYHNQCSLALLEAEKQQMMPRKEGKTNWSQVVEHPSLDLPLLLDQMRVYGQSPSSIETSVIQDFLQECKDDVQVLKSKLSDTISIISRLSRELSETSYRLSCRLDQLRLSEYLLSPQGGNLSSLLPQDILEQIFLACRQSGGMSNFKPSPNCAPLQLAAVCHRWRVIALSMPPLWANIWADSSTPSTFKLAELWIQRCSSHVLRIQVHPNENIHDFLVSLRNAASKPRQLDIAFHNNDEVHMVWSQMELLDFTELQELVLKYNHLPIELPESASQLKRLHLYTTPVSWGESPPPSQLTVLSVTSEVHWSMLEHILLHCPLLQGILICIAETGPRYSGGSHPVDSGVISQITNLPELTAFSLVNECKNDHIPIDFLHKFTFPALRAFEYYVKYPERTAITWLISLEFIPQIRRMTLHITEFPTPILPLVLNAAARLEEIYIACDASLYVLHPILEVFSSVTQSTTTAPHLARVQLALASSHLKTYAPSFSNLITSMSSPASGRLVPVNHLGIGSWKGIGEPIEFRSRLGDLGKIDLGIYDLSSRYSMYNVPLGFSMYVAPFSHSQERGVLQPDGSWKKEFDGWDIAG
ncbi:hypothetical protein BDN72DRAFT_849168 [Pluteus cervinus]|uniref:Uncharacterized protein n=1 Tax=Pluteus cervinus TaxID=181527 RepID=A0ACD3AAX8_9AGAR|nr:hypothetical protein BDN72DRAFT_849168 [Pluteus cervinus]